MKNRVEQGGNSMKNNSSHSLLSFYNSLYSFSRSYPLLKTISEVIKAFSICYVALAVQLVLSQINEHLSEKRIALNILIFTFVFLIIKVIMVFLNSSLEAKKMFLIQKDKEYKNNNLTRMPLFAFESEETQNLLNAIHYSEINGVTALDKLVDAPVLIIAGLLISLTALAFLFPLFIPQNINDVLACGIFLIFYYLCYYLSVKVKAKSIQKANRSFSKEGQSKLRKIASIIDYTYDTNINPDIRFYNKALLEEATEEEYQMSQMIFSSYWKEISKGSSVSTFLKIISYIIGTVFIAYSSFKEKTDYGSILLLSVFLEMFTSQIIKIGGEFTRIKEANRYFNDRLKIKRLSSHTKNKSFIRSNIKSNTIEFDSVSFSYPGQKDNAINNLCLVLNLNESTALVGLNGSGKSTLIKLLLKLEKPTEGRILFSDKDIWEIPDEEYQNLITAMMQDSPLFSFSLLDNIDPYREHHIEEINELLESLEFGKIDLNINIGVDNGEKGINLSGGQEKKILLARTLLRSCRYYIFDEPTSASDIENQNIIIDTINNTLKEKGYLIVSHQVSKIRNCSRIITIENGSIIQDGTWDDLINQNGLLKDLLIKEKALYGG